jgi:murein DD-endopeptidase MepM/ murein hydrolase activator NlpD
MPDKRRKRQKLKKQLFTKNRLVILNEDTFAEIFSLRLTLMNVFVVATLGAVLIIFVTTLIIAFTPLREYIPGYASPKLRETATRLAIRSDSISAAFESNRAYLSSIKKVLTGDFDTARLSKDSITPAAAPEADAVRPSEADARLRREVEQEDKYNIFEQAGPAIGAVLFSPAKGHITQPFSLRDKHYAVDVSVAHDTPVKAVANGTVIFADWTPSNANVVIIRHRDGIISAYKDCASLTASEGDVVRTGEVIAIAGPGGERSLGVHLHFELWKDGYPVDPTQFIEFE